LFDRSYGGFSRGCCGPIFDFAALSRDYNTYASGQRIDHDGQYAPFLASRNGALFKLTHYPLFR
jgi:hypothetical protein